MTDLRETILAAAAEAIQDRQAAITSEGGNLHPVNVELELSDRGQAGSMCRPEWRTMHRRKGA